jgi:hypothetical protein
LILRFQQCYLHLYLMQFCWRLHYRHTSPTPLNLKIAVWCFAVKDGRTPMWSCRPKPFWDLNCACESEAFGF